MKINAVPKSTEREKLWPKMICSAKVMYLACLRRKLLIDHALYERDIIPPFIISNALLECGK